MSHVISSQPSATSPYQPTAMQDVGNGTNIDNPPRIHGINIDQGQDDCCFHTRNRSGLCLVLCRCFSLCCQGIKRCTENCCEGCANCLNDCCEDKPRDRNRRSNQNRRYNGNSYYDNTADYNDDNTWGLSSLSEEQRHVVVGSSDCFAGPDSPYPPSGQNVSTGSHHSTGRHDSGTQHSIRHHDSGTHQSSGHHDSGTHQSSGHHDSSTCHSSGGGFDSGGGCDSGGGGDSGGGCDSGGGDCDN